MKCNIAKYAPNMRGKNPVKFAENERIFCLLIIKYFLNLLQ